MNMHAILNADNPIFPARLPPRVERVQAGRRSISDQLPGEPRQPHRVWSIPGQGLVYRLVVEAGCKTVVGRRLKQSGMFWGQTGAEDILSLRCLVLGPYFDTAWKARRKLLSQQQTKSGRWNSDPVILAN